MQTKSNSLTEVLTNVSLGFVMYWSASFIIFPLFGYEPTVNKVTGITMIHTVLAVVRGYCVRRYFNYFNKGE